MPDKGIITYQASIELKSIIDLDLAGTYTNGLEI
jgi:hypothetical protein